MAKEEAESKKKSKAKVPTAKKRDIQNQKRRTDNRVFKAKVRTAIRRFEELVSKKEESQEALNEVYALMDKGVNSGAFKLNKAARTKSRLASKAAAARSQG